MKAEANHFAVSVSRLAVLAVGCLSLASGVTAAEVDVSKLPPPATGQIDFLRDIKPILETSCLRCHNAEKAKSSFRLDSRPAALKGGEHGVDILPGKSAGSPLIHYCARLVEDMEMPPTGKGPQLTDAQVGMLRAWIDQGVVWAAGAPTNSLEFSISPTIGVTGVSGDARKYREHYWQPDGANGGLEEFDWFQQPSSDDHLVITGHALRDDYKIDLRIDRAEVGFVHAGWEQYRKYFDDTGGYYPRFTTSSFTLGRDLHLDIGKAWVDFGLTLPHWPRLVLGYEYDYRQGGEAETDWGTRQPPGSVARSILPASRQINEGVHTIKFDLDQEIKGVTLGDRFRGEFYDLGTRRTNYSPGLLSGGSVAPLGYYAEKVNEGTHYFQGANTFRLEKQFNDWLLGSGGYLYSKLDADSAFDRTTAPVAGTAPQVHLSLTQITLERESHVLNGNGQFGPFGGFNIATGVQSEWTREHGMGGGTLSSNLANAVFDPVTPGSDYDQTLVTESVAVRYTRIPFTVLFADARLEQETIGQSEQFNLVQVAKSGSLNNDDLSFAQQTDFASDRTDFRLGFNTSPWQSLSLSAHYRRSDDDSRYHNGQVQVPFGHSGTGYPGSITARDILTDEAEAKLVWNPRAAFKTSFTYQYRTTDSRTATLPLGFVSQGSLLTGQQVSDTYSINTLIYPTRRFCLSTTFSYQPTTAVTATTPSTAIVPYRGSIYSVMADATYVLTETTDLFAGYAFSTADYGQNNLATGLPLGIDYEQHNLQAGVARRFGKEVSARLQYRFNYYSEPSSGGVTDYRAHTIFATLSYKFH